MSNENGSQFLSTIIVLGFAQDTREPTVYNGREKSLSTIFVLGFWGGPRWATPKIAAGVVAYATTPEIAAELLHRGAPRDCGRGWLHMEPLKRLFLGGRIATTQRQWQGWPTVGHPETVAGGGPIWGHSRDCGRGNQFEKRTAFIKYIYSSRSSSRRIYKTTTTSTTYSFSETEIQCF